MFQAIPRRTIRKQYPTNGKKQQTDSARHGRPTEQQLRRTSHGVPCRLQFHAHSAHQYGHLVLPRLQVGAPAAETRESEETRRGVKPRPSMLYPIPARHRAPAAEQVAPALWVLDILKVQSLTVTALVRTRRELRQPVSACVRGTPGGVLAKAVPAPSWSRAAAYGARASAAFSAAFSRSQSEQWVIIDVLLIRRSTDHLLQQP